MRAALYAVMAGALALAGCGPSEGKGGVTLLNVSYDPTREFYAEFNTAFAADWKAQNNETVTIEMSNAGSGKQARAVIDGLPADVVTLALEPDIDEIAKRTGKIATDWRAKLPHDSSPYTSTIVLLVRKGNPKAIADWGDLVKDGVEVITPNPKTGGGARWNYLAALAWALKANGNDDAKARAYMQQLFAHVPVLDAGARAATTTFAQRNIGDVLITWENEGYLAIKEFGADKFEIVYPSLSILAQPPVALVEGNADKHGARKVAEAYLQYLYTPAGQKLAAKHYFRPVDASAADPADMARFRQVEMVTVDDTFGGWAKAQETHFADGGVFDQVSRPASPAK